MAEIASSGDIQQLKKIRRRLRNKDPVVRYWAATGCISLGKEAASAKGELRN